MYLHVLRLLGTRYRLDVVLDLVCAGVMVVLLNLDWLRLNIALESKVPLMDRLFPSADMALNGWSIMGLFGFLPLLLPLVGLVAGRGPKMLYVLVAIWFSNLLHLLHYEVLEWQMGGHIPSYLTLEGNYQWPVWGYFSALGLMTLGQWFFSGEALER